MIDKSLPPFPSASALAYSPSDLPILSPLPFSSLSYHFLFPHFPLPTVSSSSPFPLLHCPIPPFPLLPSPYSLIFPCFHPTTLLLFPSPLSLLSSYPLLFPCLPPPILSSLPTFLLLLSPSPLLPSPLLRSPLTLPTSYPLPFPYLPPILSSSSNFLLLSYPSYLPCPLFFPFFPLSTVSISSTFPLLHYSLTLHSHICLFLFHRYQHKASPLPPFPSYYLLFPF